MRNPTHPRTVLSIGFVALALVALPACGGGGQGFRAASTPALVVSSGALPQALSGQAIDFEIPIDGGCGGPYVVEVIAGQLPDGLSIDDDGGRHHIVGVVLMDGTFNFTVQITDTSCNPFASTTQSYSWSIQQGSIRIVAVDPPVIPQDQFDDPAKHVAGAGEEPIDAFQTTVYNQQIAFDLIVAGGSGDFDCAVIDDPNDPNDGPLPLGAELLPNSCSIFGRPNQVAAGGVPFLMTFRVTDNVTGEVFTRKFQWKIDTPPIILATPSIADGQAGQSYSEVVQVVDGVPPFNYELVDTPLGVANEDIVYSPPTAPDLQTAGLDVGVGGSAADGSFANKATAADYPSAADAGPYTPAPSEGLTMKESGVGAGTLAGLPRRVGTFTIHVHVYSDVVPNERGQHAFQTFTHSIALSDPLAMNPSFTDEGAFGSPPDYATLPELTFGFPYNPDAGSHAPSGLQLLATGGVPFDGVTDAPHRSQQAPAPQEVADKYAWTVDWDPLSQGYTQPPAIELFPAPGGAPYSDGVFGTTSPTSLQRQSRQLLAFSVEDQQLPLALRNTETRPFGFSVGPDKAIITESSTSFTHYYTASYGYFDLNDVDLTVRRFEVIGGSAILSDLDANDMTANHVIPSIAATGLTSDTALDELLSGASPGDDGLDLLRICVNATGWWDDSAALNPLAARPFQHGDAQMSYGYRGMGYPYYGGSQPNAACVELPDAQGVTPNANAGVFADGGRLYAFDSDDRMGFFIIRSNASVYVPFATEKGTYESFGDAMFVPRQNRQHSLLRSLHITVSPDGRLAACKIKSHPADPSTATNSYLNENASQSRVVVFSLTGEKLWDGGTATYKIVDPDGPGLVNNSFSGTNVMFAPSMALTNRHLYYIIGTRVGSSAAYYYTASWRDHYVMRYEVLDGTGSATNGASASLAPGSGNNWTNTNGSPMQTPFHKWDNPTLFYSSSYGRFTQYETHVYDGTNFAEHEMAPVPFRVNRGGDHCAVLASPTPPTTTSYPSGSYVMRHYAWVDRDGSGFVQATQSTAVRHAPQGAARGYGLIRGPSTFRHWGAFQGPTTGFEISDDGNRLAYVVHTQSSISSTSSSAWPGSQQEVVACSTTDGWANATETDVTGSLFAGSHYWRFGSLVFTADGDGLIFWGGYSSRNSTTTSTAYNISYHYAGTYYSWNFDTNTLRSVLPSSAGGNADGIKSYSTSSTVNPTAGTHTGNQGRIRPVTGFLSKNRNFFYVCSQSAVSTSDGTGCQLVGINVSTLDGGSINGHANGQGFLLDNYRRQYGFLPGYHYYPLYTFSYRYYAPAKSHGMGYQVAAKDTGWVYWVSHYQYAGPVSNTTYGPSAGTYYYDYGARGGTIYAFDPNVGGQVHNLTHHGLDTTAYRMLQYLDVTNDGSRIAYVYTAYSTLRYIDYEHMGFVHGFSLEPDGSLSPGFDRNQNSLVIEGSRGRAGDGLAFDSGGTRLFYAYRAGSNDEANKQLVQLVLNADGSVTQSRFTSGKRFNVLFAGR